MDIKTLRNGLIEQTIIESGFEDRRYLGMSRIADCPLVLYRLMLQGEIWTEEQHLLTHLGYLFEQSMKDRLVRFVKSIGDKMDLTLTLGRELIAPYDKRVQGHIDAAFVGGPLIEFKSVYRDKFNKIMDSGRLPYRNFRQIQMYIHHGGYERCWTIFVCRDTNRIVILDTRYMQSVADDLDAKARRILRAVDTLTPPACECERCDTIRAKIPA